MTVALVVVGLVAAGVVVGVVVLAMLVARAQRNVQGVLAGREVVTAENAQSFGIASRPKRQLRGSGTLALCHDSVVFVQWLPQATVEIPLGDLTAVDTTSNHLGKSIGRPLLRLSWATPDGVDQLAVHVRDVARWVAALPTP